MLTFLSEAASSRWGPQDIQLEFKCFLVDQKTGRHVPVSVKPTRDLSRWPWAHLDLDICCRSHAHSSSGSRLTPTTWTKWRQRTTSSRNSSSPTSFPEVLSFHTESPTHTPTFMHQRSTYHYVADYVGFIKRIMKQIQKPKYTWVHCNAPNNLTILFLSNIISHVNFLCF